MLTANQTTNIVLIVLIAIYFSVLVVGIKNKQTGSYAGMLNLIAGLCILIYWVQKQVRTTQHLYYSTEILLIGFEVIVIASAIYLLLSKKVSNWVFIIQHVLLGIHLVALVLFFVFMMTFKIKRLI